jgi:hypothetical protein
LRGACCAQVNLLWQYLGKKAVKIKSIENSTISGKYTNSRKAVTTGIFRKCAAKIRFFKDFSGYLWGFPEFGEESLSLPSSHFRRGSLSKAIRPGLAAQVPLGAHQFEDGSVASGRYRTWQDLVRSDRATGVAASRLPPESFVVFRFF